MPVEPSDSSVIGEGHDTAPGSTVSIKSVYSSGDLLAQPVDLWLHEANFFHGYLPREDIPPLLSKHGDFLVRISEANVKATDNRKKAKKKKALSRVISVLVDSQSKNETVPLEKRLTLIKNIVILHMDRKWFLDPCVQFDTLALLFENYQSKPLLIEKEQVLLKRGIGLCSWEFKHAHVQVGRLIGKGAYGEVRKGTVIQKDGQIVNVAVKTLTVTKSMTRELIREIMKEARIMRDLHHTNVVSMIGVVLVDHPLYILLEYVSGGALDMYLKKRHTKLSREERLGMILQVASGMDYIHKANIIHRDLAARNCLYDRSNTVKISDFGLSRSGSSYKMKTAQKMPIKWMAPESILTFTFTQKTDIYTFGVLIFEVFAAIGPYNDLRNSVVKKMIVEGKVNEFPANTPDYIVKYVKENLWCKDPEKRPDFTTILAQLEQLISSNMDLEKPEVVDEIPSASQTNEGKSVATVELDMIEEPKCAVEVKKSPVLNNAAGEVPTPRSAKSVDSAKVSSTEGTSKSTLGKVRQKPSTSKPKSKELPKSSEDAKRSVVTANEKTDPLKAPQSDADSRREKDEFNVEIRTKPVFGRRSKLKRTKK